MENKENVIQELFNKLEQLNRQQKVFQEEIQKIHRQLRVLQDSEKQTTPLPDSPVTRSVAPDVFIAPRPSSPAPTIKDRASTATKRPWEEFIGTNLLNKVGIAVLVIGIGFGAKYSIDHNVINDQTRTILGYLLGCVLVGLAFKVKENHPGFSAVLLSGGMAVLYFITYAAYDFYGLIPQAMAFAMMVIFTAFTVFAAVRYDLEVIGIIGMVGAYAVPILLSDGSGRVMILFSYITIINLGILFLAFRKYWKRLYYLAFILTWLTFGSWYAISFDARNHVAISLIFSTLFFLIFYTTFLAYKLIRKEPLGRWDVVCMLVNSFVYFGYGYLTIDSMEDGSQYLGLFTVFTALMHFIACLIIYKNQGRFGDIFYFVAGMVLVFLTIAVPVQLEGGWVTLVWAGEAALLFWIGRSKNFPTYEKLSYPLVVLAFISLLHDWSNHYRPFDYYVYNETTGFTIFLNVAFLTSMLVGASFLLLLYILQRYPQSNAFKPDSPLTYFPSIGVPLLALIVFYGGIYKEIGTFWNHRYAGSHMLMQGSDDIEYDQYNTSLLHFKNIWLMIYSSVFAAVLCLIQMKLNRPLLGYACVAINIVVLLAFITQGFLDLSALRSVYLSQDLAAYYDRGYGHILIRHAAIVVMLPLLWFNWKLVRQGYFQTGAPKIAGLFFHFVTLAVLSSELIHWLEMARVENTFKLSLSILWGAYALFLIVLGLARDEKHIRLAAIVLFAVTLLKLFAYDMADMSTILKTVVMIILGALLLTASFIYNKYKRAAGNETR